MNESRRTAALAPVLVMTTLVSSIISALGAPLIPTIARDFHDSLGTAQWSLTVGLLSGAVCAPIMGRLGDGPRRRATMIGGLAVVTLGGVVAALAPGIVVLIIGRALQGVGLGLVPLAMATARDNMSKERVAPMIGLLSVSAAAGVGAGYPISGLIADGVGLSGAYWFGAIVSGVTLLCVAVVVPLTNSDSDRPPRLDTIGSVLLAMALTAILVGVAQGAEWGWRSPAILGLLAAGLLLFAVWVPQQLRGQAPLVNLHLLRHPAVLAGDVCAMVLGIAMYMGLSAGTEFVQLPRSGGFGFSASVLVAGLILIPMSAFMLLGSRALPTLVGYLGVRTLLTVGCLVVAASCVFFALFHGELWEAFVMMGILGIGLGTTYAAIPGLIVRSVPPRETGSAMGFYQVVRYVGFSLGSAVTASILTSHTSSSTGRPDLVGYTTVFWAAGAICILAALLAWVVSVRGERDEAPGPTLDDDEVRLLEQTEGEDLVVGGTEPR
jgi:predicted MFS family arabinose efflux permease